MGIFFSSEGAPPSLNQALIRALKETPPANDQAAQEKAKELAATVQPPARSLNLWSVVIALLFLGALFAGCFYTASNDKLADLYNAMLHAFQVMLGLVPGALLGENSAR